MAKIVRPEPYVTVRQVIEHTGFAEQTLQNWRSQRRGPRFYRVGNKILYRLSEVDAWIEQQQPTPRARRNLRTA